MHNTFFIFLVVFFSIPSYGQILPVDNAAVAAGFLSVAPDAVSGALGNTGTGGNCDVFSLYHNPAKYAFGERSGGIGLFYNPWGASYAKHLRMSGGVGFWQRKMNTFSAGFRYFSYGEMELSDEDAVVTARVQPYELAADIAYTLQLSPYVAGGVGFKYIYSYLGQLAMDGVDKGASACAFDVSFFYRRKQEAARNNRWLWGIGIRAENIGSKLSYYNGDGGYFLPAMLKIGVSVEFAVRFHKITLLCDLGKLLVPVGVNETLRNESVFGCIGKSFRHFSWKDLFPGIGIEYACDEWFRFRTGYYYEHPSLGNQQFVSFGCGGGWRHFYADVAYQCYTGNVTAIDNRLKISCQYEF